PHRADPARVLEVLELAGREGADVASLSGGERQRVALARAVCSGPDLLVLDEPLSGLDLPLRRRILPYLVRVQREFAVPSLYVSHDVTEVRLLSREAIVLQEGREVARGEPDRLFTRPDRIASLGAAEIENILHGTIVSQDGASARIDLGDGRFVLVPSAPAPATTAPGRVSVLVRAEELIVAVEPPRGLSAQNLLSGTLTGLVDMHAGPGGDVGIALVVDVGPRQPAMIALVTEQACESLRLRTPMPVHLVWKTHACRMVPG
ncbi:MAG TPA: ATP-binding cassette domain-containing protein, partial [Candidatus Polarisedimenticolia bacterium]|nr:ATP-binding cassette domain-containing protein [Candidatus Polarisedimenticolia bacterium]